MKRGFTIYNENEGISTDQSKPKERPVGIKWLDDAKRVAFADANIQVADESKPPKLTQRKALCAIHSRWNHSSTPTTRSFISNSQI